jgi:hypothetical protein
MTWDLPRGWSVRACAIGLAVAAIGLIWVDRALSEGLSLEEAVKASYLYKFAPFVQWPPSAFAGPADSFKICVVGDDPFGSLLDDAVKGQQVNGRPIVVHRPAAAVAGMDCQILFAGRSASQSMADMFGVVAGRPVLTVVDQELTAPGAMIRFVQTKGRVRFDIDAARAQASGLEISSKLLGLAVSVQRAAK